MGGNQLRPTAFLFRLLSMPTQPRPTLVLRWVLRLVVVLETIGLGGRYLFGPNETESDVYGLLYLDWGYAEALAQLTDDIGHWACLAGGMLVLVLSTASLGRDRTAGAVRQPSLIDRTEQVASLTVFAWFLVIAIAHMLRGERFAELSLGEHAVRFTAPLVLAMVAGQRTDFSATQDKPSLAMRLLAFAAAATFAVHGYKALVQYGGFADLILLTDQRWFHLELSQVLTERTLVTIGLVDIVVAAWIAVRFTPAIAFYMTFWGLLTACSRVTAFGDAAWPEILIRAANYGVPLAVGLAAVSVRQSRLAKDEPPKLNATATLASGSG